MKGYSLAVIGGQWGDEGKGKISSLLAPQFDAVCRFQGGHNAGHTVVKNGVKHALHLIPAGILDSGKTCILGCGMVIDPRAFVKETSNLAAQGYSLENLFLSDRAHLILPYHQLLDEAREKVKGDKKIGTTLRGIGPAYETKAMREGIRAGDLRSKELFARKVEKLAGLMIPVLEKIFGMTAPSPAQVAADLEPMREAMLPRLTDTSLMVNRMLDDGKKVLLEGAQATLLDVDLGTYPYVTSSNSSAAGIAGGLGISPKRISAIIGVFKAYCTRVGGGPFVTELDNETGNAIRERGREYGTSTGRPRRCGWFDGVAARYASRVNDFDFTAVTLLDVLDTFPELNVAERYALPDGSELSEFPSDEETLAAARPRYRTINGWESSTRGISDYAALPHAARSYLEAIEQLSGKPHGIVSTGPDNRETVLRPEQLERIGLRGI
jgi:adenylosuccinate synthase